MVTAKHLVTTFQAMSNDANAAICAGWRELVDRAFEAVERKGFALGDDLKKFVVVIAARIAGRHWFFPF